MTSDKHFATELSHLVRRDPDAWNVIQSNLLDGVWYNDIADPNRGWISPDYWRVFGIDAEASRPLLSDWQGIIYSEDLALERQNLARHCADPSHPYDQIVRYRHADGSTVWLRRRGVAIRDDDGKPLRLLGAHTDITPVKESEENARACWRAAERTNAELKSFAASISDVMKTPTFTLRLLLEELKEQTGESPQSEVAEIAAMGLQTVSRIQTFIKDILDYTRIIGVAPQFAPVDLQHCAETATTTLSKAIEDADATVTIEDLPIISGMADQMTLLFQNLIENAVKFRDASRPLHVRISCSQEEDNDVQLISVRDNGRGIAPHNQDRIFDIFERLHNCDALEGSGLGLPICQHIAAVHQGDLTVESRRGRGATFTLALPL